MKKKRKFDKEGYEYDDPTDEDFPVGKLKLVQDFLPPPEELAKAKVIVKVTIGLDLATVRFFQDEARKHKTKYQRMIREVLNNYTSHYKTKAA